MFVLTIMSTSTEMFFLHIYRELYILYFRIDNLTLDSLWSIINRQITQMLLFVQMLYFINKETFDKCNITTKQ